MKRIDKLLEKLKIKFSPTEPDTIVGEKDIIEWSFRAGNFHLGAINGTYRYKLDSSDDVNQYIIKHRPPGLYHWITFDGTFSPFNAAMGFCEEHWKETYK